MPYYQPKGGWIEIICGSMFSGKTEELIRRVRRAKSHSSTWPVFKPKLDDRYSASQVASHDGGHAEAEVIEPAAEIMEKLAPQTTVVVAIDEAQFFDWGVADVARLPSTAEGREVRRSPRPSLQKTPLPPSFTITLRRRRG